ncbi:MAG: phosphohydrolase [bacterium]|nr:phosphohydrolase [bacterium]
MEPFTIETAIQIACEFHRGQNDKAGFPYIFHPLRVMENVNGIHQKMAAVLHDTIEDTPLTIEELRNRGCPPRVVGAVEVLTKREGESHDQYIMRVVESGNPVAIPVKWADITDNSDPRRLQYLPVESQQRLSLKYAAAKRLLMENM